MPEIDVLNTYQPSFSEGEKVKESSFSIEEGKKKEKSLPSTDSREEAVSALKTSTNLLVKDLKAYAENVSENYTQEDKQVLSRVFKILTHLIKNLQTLAIGQADNMQLLTEFQRSLTELQTQIPMIMADGTTPKTPLATKDGEGKQDFLIERNQMNERLQIWGENLRNVRSAYEQDAKKMQSAVNSTHQAVSRLMDLFTVLLRETQELVSIILR